MVYQYPVVLAYFFSIFKWAVAIAYGCHLYLKSPINLILTNRLCEFSSDSIWLFVCVKTYFEKCYLSWLSKVSIILRGGYLSATGTGLTVTCLVVTAQSNTTNLLMTIGVANLLWAIGLITLSVLIQLIKPLSSRNMEWL